MKPKRIFLVRHGESEGNIDKSCYSRKPDYTLELTEKGRQQARMAGERLRILTGDERVFFYVSPMWRTRSTFEQISRAFNKSNLVYREEPRIREQEWGHLRTPEESKEVEQARDAYGTFYFRIPDGESAADVYDRISDFFGTLHRDFLKPDFPQNAVIVTHGMAIRLFLMKWFHWTVEEFELLANPGNCEIIEFVKGPDDKYILISEIKRWNKVYHPYSRPVNLDESG